MAATEASAKPATASEIREIVGPIEDEILTGILALGATREEVLEAETWLSSDDYLHRQLHHGLSGRAAEVFAILETTLPEPDQP
jgi:hypothetical protein